jgi:hypothetical protein
MATKFVGINHVICSFCKMGQHGFCIVEYPLYIPIPNFDDEKKSITLDVEISRVYCSCECSDEPTEEDITFYLQEANGDSWVSSPAN